VTLIHLPLSWQGSFWYFRHPLDFLGSDGGGPGISVGAALALKGSGRLAVGICVIYVRCITVHLCPSS
jgi:hypothetical protein